MKQLIHKQTKISRLTFMWLVYFWAGSYLNAEAVIKTTIAAGNWNDAAIWNPSGVPIATDEIIINHAIILNVNIDITAPGSITVNTNGSLKGSTFIIDFNGGTSSAAVAKLVNKGIIEVAAILESTGCAYSVIDNYGIIDLTGSLTAFPNGVLVWRAAGKITNYAGATINALTGMIRVSNQDMNAGGACEGQPQPTIDNYGTFNVIQMEMHAFSILNNMSTGQILVVDGGTGLWLGAYDFNNYGCIIADGDVNFNAKLGNQGHNNSTLHDGSKIYVKSTGTLSIASSSHTITGIDDDGNNANNACIYSETNITNVGTITGELFLNDNDGVITGGTIGAQVVKGTNNCGGALCAEPCPNPNCGTATIIKN